ncbi:hypothetical protein [Aminobacter sp. MDW-2]|uniref:hypothetical protein n=1 Tax=Aminobacter sp. MDW-2 TaxID=2666139 RepID=UPI0012B06336|nr:hypothetical protein [Aminobacter sp. MDW-2]MRX31924.1 hypothetical protein [Aminobacter sp. MDW-2]QNH32397.1 hypothetical protein H5P29_17765 [Aminobacter sp. MDW-2]
MVVRLLIFCLLLLGLADIAMAGKNDAEWNPPARYDHPYTGNLKVRYLPPKDVYRLCAKMLKDANGSEKGTYPGMRGCSVLKKGGKRCNVVVVDRTWKKATPEAVLRHEIGHCNGWPFEHPD